MVQIMVKKVISLLMLKDFRYTLIVTMMVFIFFLPKVPIVMNCTIGKPQVNIWEAFPLSILMETKLHILTELRLYHIIWEQNFPMVYLSSKTIVVKTIKTIFRTQRPLLLSM